MPDGSEQNGQLVDETLINTGIGLTIHSKDQRRRHLIHLVLMVLLLSSIYPLLLRSNYRGRLDVHGIMEMLSALFGFAIGFFLVNRFINYGERCHLFIGLAFFMSGVADFFHGLVGVQVLTWFGPTELDFAHRTVYTFVGGRLLLGTLLAVAMTAPPLMGRKRKPVVEAVPVIIAVAVVSIILYTLFLRLSPSLVYTEGLSITRRADFLTGFLMMAVLLGFLYRYMRNGDMLLWWITISIAANMIGQFYIGLSREFYDPFFDIGHVYKVFGYIIPLVGYSLYDSGSITERKLARKDELEVMVRERTLELEKANESLRDELIERKRAEEEVSRIAAELSQFISTANAPIFGIDIDGRINEWNRAAERITNYSKDQVLGKHLVDDFISDTFRMKVREVLDRALDGIETANFELPLLTRDGKRVMVLLNATTRRDTHGTIIGVMGVGQDITELNRYREQLEHLVDERTRELNRSLVDTAMVRDRIDAILKSVADGLIVTDTYNRVVLMNRAAEDLLRVRLSEVIDRPVDFAIEENTLREKVKETLDKKVTGYQFDFDMDSGDPEHPRIMRARTSVILDRQANVTGIVTIIHDVTHEREVDRMKTEFLSTAAHELRTPLTSIQGFSEILLTRDNLGNDEKKKFLTYINKQAVNLAGIVSDLLNISRIESGHGYALEKIVCDIGDTIHKVVPYFQEISGKHKIVLDIEDKPVELFIDRDKIEQVLKNLLSNAVKYSPGGGDITINGRSVDGSYIVSVRDHGIGMTADQVSRVFEKFYRANSSDSAPEGTGLGMTIVKHIVEAHGGEVAVESEFGEGTTITFTLPMS